MRRSDDITSALGLVGCMRHHLRTLRGALIACVLILLSACATQRATTTSAQFLLVRHAAVVEDDPDDPALSPHGIAQAQALAGQLAHTPLAGIEVSEFKRTQQTAAPTAAQHRQSPARYYARGDVTEIARQWQLRYRSGQVLVVTDAGMLTALAAALCQCEVAPADDDTPYLVTPASSGPGSVTRTSLTPR